MSVERLKSLTPRFEVVFRFRRAVDLGARADPHLEAGLHRILARLPHLGMQATGVIAAGLADAQAVVGRPELDHVDAGHPQDLLQVLHRAALLDHDRDHGVVVVLDVVRRLSTWMRPPAMPCV